VLREREGNILRWERRRGATGAEERGGKCGEKRERERREKGKKWERRGRRSLL
jgi:hypothetical protein